MSKKKIKPKAKSLEKLVLLKDQITELWVEYEEELVKAVEKYGEGDFWYGIEDENYSFMKVSLMDNRRALSVGEDLYVHKKVNKCDMKQQAVKREPKETQRICS